MKAKTILSIIILTGILTGIVLGNNTSALEYQTKAGVNFTLLPSISVSLSSPDLIIDDLLPNTSSDSNEIIVNVESNNVSGYVLNSSVGSSTITGSNNTSYNNRNLTNTSSNSYIFTSLDYGSSIPDMSSESVDPNTWGYSYSDQTVETPTWSAYSGLPLYSDTTNIATLKSSDTTSLETGDSIKFKIAAKASITQGSGEYTNIINFIAVGNPTPTSFYDAFTNAASQPGSTISQLNGYYKMQDMTADICSAVDNSTTDPQTTTLIDIRDNKTYTIAKLANACWMTQNLAIEPGTHMTASDTNITSAQYLEGKDYYALPGEGYDLRIDGAGGGNCFGTYSSSTATYSGEGWASACSHVADATDLAASSSLGYTKERLGAWYNYAAATAGTINTKGANTTAATYDICPGKWHLPTYSTKSPAGSINSIIEQVNAFNPLYSGNYHNHSHNDVGTIGYWWSADAEGASLRRYLVYRDSDGSLYPYGSFYRYLGNSVRCVYLNN